MIRSSHGSNLLRRLLVGGIALLIPVLAGCEAGNNAPTLEFHPAANGAYATTDNVSIINAFILGAPDSTPLPAGSSASMFVGLYNGNASPDKLISVTASGTATSVQISGGSIALPAQGPSYLTGPAPKIVLRGLTRSLSGGQTVNVLLTFQNAGTVQVAVPVEARQDSYASYLPPAPSASATKRLKPGATRPATATPAPGTSVSPSPTVSPSPSASTVP